MRRLARPAFSGLAIVSLLLCVATAALWVRSYWRYDRWTDNGPGWTASVCSVRGRLYRTRATAAGSTSGGSVTLRGPQAGFHSVAVTPASTDSIVEGHPGGFARVRVGDPSWGSVATDMAPHWSLALLTALAPGAWLIVPRPRPAAGRCRACGYDLTGNVSGVCPECGTKVG